MAEAHSQDTPSKQILGSRIVITQLEPARRNNEQSEWSTVEGAKRPLGATVTSSPVPRRRGSFQPPTDYTSLFRKLVPSGGSSAPRGGNEYRRMCLNDILQYILHPPGNPNDNSFLRLIKENRISTVASHPHELETTPFWQQGDMSLHTPEMIKRRMGLRTDSQILSETRLFWDTCDTVPSQDAITQDEYGEVITRVAKSLLPDFSFAEAHKIIRENWNELTAGTRYMRYETFHESLFDLADIWCMTVSVSDYVAILRRLYYNITTEPPEPVWNDIEHIRYVPSLGPGRGDMEQLFPAMAGSKCQSPLLDLVPFFFIDGEKNVALLLADGVQTIGELCQCPRDRVGTLLPRSYPILHVEVALYQYYYGPFFVEQDRQAAIAIEKADREEQERQKEIRRLELEQERQEKQRQEREFAISQQKVREREFQRAETEVSTSPTRTLSKFQQGTSTNNAAERAKDRALRAQQEKTFAREAFLRTAGIIPDGDIDEAEALFPSLQGSHEPVDSLLVLLPDDDGYRGTFQAKRVFEIGDLAGSQVRIVKEYPQVDAVEVLRAALERYSRRRGHYPDPKDNELLCPPLQHCELTIRPIALDLGNEWAETFKKAGITTIAGLASLKKGYVASFPHPPDPVGSALGALLSYYKLHVKYSNSVMLGLDNDNEMELFPLLRECSRPISEFLETLMSFFDQWKEVFSDENILSVADLARTKRGDVRRWTTPLELRHGPLSYLENALHSYYRQYDDDLYTASAIVTGPHKTTDPVAPPASYSPRSASTPRDEAKFLPRSGHARWQSTYPNKTRPGVSGFFPDSYDPFPQGITWEDVDGMEVHVTDNNWDPQSTARIVVAGGTTALKTRLINLTGHARTNESGVSAGQQSAAARQALPVAKIKAPDGNSRKLGTVGEKATPTSVVTLETGAHTPGRKQSLRGFQKSTNRLKEPSASHRWFPSRIRRSRDIPQSRALHEAEAIEFAQAEIQEIQECSTRPPDSRKEAILKQPFKKPPVIDVTEPAHLMHVKTLVDQLRAKQLHVLEQQASSPERRKSVVVVRPDVQGTFSLSRSQKSSMKRFDTQSSLASGIILCNSEKPEALSVSEGSPRPRKSLEPDGFLSHASLLSSSIDILYGTKGGTPSGTLLDSDEVEVATTLSPYNRQDFGDDVSHGKQRLSMTVDLSSLRSPDNREGVPRRGAKGRRARPATSHGVRSSWRSRTYRQEGQAPSKPLSSKSSLRSYLSHSFGRNPSAARKSRSVSHLATPSDSRHTKPRRPSSARSTGTPGFRQTRSAFGRTLSDHRDSQRTSLEESWSLTAPPTRFTGLHPQRPRTAQGAGRKLEGRLSTRDEPVRSTRGSRPGTALSRNTHARYAKSNNPMKPFKGKAYTQIQIEKMEPVRKRTTLLSQTTSDDLTVIPVWSGIPVPVVQK